MRLRQGAKVVDSEGFEDGIHNGENWRGVRKVGMLEMEPS
jgi:hypothetical protein